MCGITFIVGANTGPGPIRQMTDRLAHRGPDGSGILELPGCQLGHRRLSIIDLAGGVQPMRAGGGRYSITFNGEIYNYRDIAAELASLGVITQTASDTEVLLLAYMNWGRKCLDKLRGMFAFAIWDSETGTLFGARDPFGEKPLYLCRPPGGGLWGASEIKGLLAGLPERPGLDLQAIDAMLVHGFVPPTLSAWRGIYPVPPGHYFTWQHGQLQISEYWHPQLGGQTIGMDEAVERVQALAAQAVRRQTVADVPIGAFLSGGLDSTSVVSFLAQATGGAVNTFSVGFGTLINELPAARLVAERYGTRHHEIDLGDPPVGELLPLMAGIYDEPFADSSHIPTHMISAFARQHVTVALSGDGGDEVFGGYPWYADLALASTAPASLAAYALLRLARLMPGRRRDPLMRRRLRAASLARRGGPDVQLAAVHAHVPLAMRQRWWGGQGPTQLYHQHLPPQNTDVVQRAIQADLDLYLPGDILVKVDRAAMANSLETRAPFLDRDLAEFALSLPSSLKVEGERTRQIERAAFAARLPASLLNRPKQGFGAPFSIWLQRPDVGALMHRVMQPQSPLRRLLPGLNGTEGQKPSFRAWILLSLGLWLETV